MRRGHEGALMTKLRTQARRLVSMSRALQVGQSHSRTRLVRSPAAGLHHHGTTFLTNDPPACEIKERKGEEETGHLLPINIW